MKSRNLRCVIFIVSLYVTNVFGQVHKTEVYINNGVDKTQPDIAEVIGLWKNYLNSRPDSVYDNMYWCSEEKQRYKDFDLLRNAYFYPSVYLMMPVFKPTVLSVSATDSAFIVRTLFSSTDSGFASPLCITEIAAQKENGVYKLRNVLPYNTASWKKATVGKITFHFPAEHHFDNALAAKMNSFTDSVAFLWSITNKPVDYYFADNIEKVYNALGLNFYIGEGNTKHLSGFTDKDNRIIYGGGNTEWYPHEFVHVTINPVYPNAHGIFQEGYATFLGGLGNGRLSWHLNRLNRYLQEHKEINLNNPFSFWHMDFTTDPQKVIGGLLCQMAEAKGGLPAIKKLFSYGNSDEQFYAAVKAVFGVSNEQLNDFLRKNISKYAER